MKTVTFTFDELHAFSEHYTWNILEQDVPVEQPLQSFIDKVLYDSTIKDIEDNSPYNKIPTRY